MTTQTLTLTKFLLARIAEDEAVAQNELDHGDGPRWWGDWLPEHVSRHDPARVLAECEAKRRIVGLHQCIDERRTYNGDVPLYCDPCQTVDGYGGDAIGDRGVWPCPTLKALAAVYADHPDYREWLP